MQRYEAKNEVEIGQSSNFGDALDDNGDDTGGDCHGRKHGLEIGKEPEPGSGSVFSAHRKTSERH